MYTEHKKTTFKDVKQAKQRYKKAKQLMYDSEEHARRHLGIKCDDGWRMVFFGHVGYTLCLGCLNQQNCPDYAKLKPFAEERYTNYVKARDNLFHTIKDYVKDSAFVSQLAEYKKKKYDIKALEDIYYYGSVLQTNQEYVQDAGLNAMKRLAKGVNFAVKRADTPEDQKSLAEYLQKVNDLQKEFDNICKFLSILQPEQLKQIDDEYNYARQELDNYKKTMSLPAKIVATFAYGR